MTDAQDRRFQKRVGTTIRDKWHIDAFLDAGAMAAVYAATHRNGMRGALKILHKHLSRDASLQKRFLREAYLANKVNHPSALKVLDDDVTEDGCAFLVLELLEGESLEARRQRLGKLDLMDVLDIGDQLLDVLAAAHAAGVIHRDLKPENVLVLRNGMIKVLDFGIAQVWDGARSSEVTETGTIIGSPSYMPPEQARGARDEIGARSDIWAVGATLFVLMSGETVHSADSPQAKMLLSANKPARTLREVAPEIPRAVASVIDRALAFDRADRWPDAEAMREALKWARIGLGGASRAHSSSAPPPRTTEETVTDFDVRAIEERVKELMEERAPEFPKPPAEDVMTRDRRALEEAPTVAAFPKPMPARTPGLTDSDPTIRREPAGPSRSSAITGQPPPEPPNVPMPPAPPAAPSPRRAAPRLLGFVLGGVVLLAMSAVAALLAFGMPRLAANTEPAVSTTPQVVFSQARSVAPAAAASSAPSVPGAKVDPLAARNAELGILVDAGATHASPPTIAASDLPVAAAPPPPRRRRPRPAPSTVASSTEPPLPNFPIPEPEPTTTTARTTAAATTTPPPLPPPVAPDAPGSSAPAGKNPPLSSP